MGIATIDSPVLAPVGRIRAHIPQLLPLRCVEFKLHLQYYRIRYESNKNWDKFW